MDKERYNQIFDEAYKNYYKSHTSPPSNPGGPLLSDNLISIRPIQYTQEEFINKSKTDSEFSKKWGLKIEERVLSTQERNDIHKKYITEDKLDLLWEHATHENLDKLGVPTKLITITYNNEKTEIYE